MCYRSYHPRNDTDQTINLCGALDQREYRPGFGRRHYLGNAKFIRNSFESQHECLDYLITAVDEGLIPRAGIDEFRPVFEEAKAPSKGSAAYLAKSTKR